MKALKKAITFFLLFSTLLSLFSCAKSNEQDAPHSYESLTDSEAPTESNTDEQEDIPSQMDVERWIANEITFTSDKTYTDPVYSVTLDVVFKNTETNKVLSVPAFWDGGATWKVRFALTQLGKWTYYTKCSDKENESLHSLKGAVNCVPYSGELEIYKHGFVKVKSGTRYFIYDDGTPFFYLGDTHWTLPIEDFDGAGILSDEFTFGISQELATERKITSQFKHTVDYRAKQGYTVIQSQPLGIYTGRAGNSWLGDANGSIFDYGVNEAMLAKFQELDKYFAYIAQAGLLHANSQLGYPEELIECYLGGVITDKKIDMLCRYWVARYSAYPVLWTTTQEGDNDYYQYEWDKTNHPGNKCTTENNPWLLVMSGIAKYDPYDHPSTCHQENTDNTRVDNSTFGKKSTHKWYASQWYAQYTNGTSPDWHMLKEYWNNAGSKPVVNYEARYDHFWAGTNNARAQAWITYLNGQAGFAYGAQPLFNLCWAENEKNRQSTQSFENESFDLDITWLEGLELEAGEQVTYARKFLEKFEWWKLVPCFDSSSYYSPEGKNYSVATVKNELYVGYFYGSDTASLGSFTSMQNATYEIGWMDCRTGELTAPTRVTVTNGAYDIPNKPSSGDWAIYAKLVQN